MSVPREASLDDLPKWLLIHFEQVRKRDGLHMESTCYSVDHVSLSERPPEYSSVRREVSEHMLDRSIMQTLDIVTLERSDMAKMLTKEAPLSGPQDCVLVTKGDWDDLKKRAARAEKFASLWKRLARKYFMALGFVFGQ